MHDFSTRAWKNRRQASAIIRSLLAAFFVLSAPFSPHASTLQSGDDPQANAKVGPSPITPAYDATILLVEHGHEGLQLSARLAEGSEPLAHRMLWKVIDSSGLLLSENTAPAMVIDLQPGTYQIQVSYGSALYRRTITLEPGQRQELSLLLEAGAIRILASAKGLKTDRPAVNFVYANSGPNKGRLLTVSTKPGEVLPLAAGTYRVESRLEPGNAVLTTDVTIRPGIMSSVNVSHNAGLMRFRYARQAASGVRWQIVASGGQVLLQLQGGEASAVLRPGTYRVEMQAEGRTAASQFELSAGEEKSLQLGN